MKAFFNPRFQLVLFAICAFAFVASGHASPDSAMGIYLLGATLNSGALTLADWTKRLDPEGKIPAIGEILSQTNEILEDAVFMEGNLPTGHRMIIRTGLPTVYYRSINQGVPTSKSTTVQVDEACGILEARSHIDVELAKLAGEQGAFRLSEDSAFLESMNQTMAKALLYGNPTLDPRQPFGLTPRYSAISGAGNAQNILTASGTTSLGQTSIWLVGWGENTIFCPFPKGSMAGLSQQDLGEESVPDAAGNYYQALRSLYQWKNGLAVKDWRYAVRICNVDIADLIAQTGTQATTAATTIINLMSRALDRLPAIGNCRPCFYANRTVYSMLRVAAMNKSQNALSIEQAVSQFGTAYALTRFQGVPLRKVDQILSTEAVVS